MCGRQDHYKKVCPEIECHKCYKKGECPLRESGYSSGRSSDRMRRHERRLKDRNRRPLSIFILVSVYVRMNVLSVLVRLDLLAITMLLMVIVTVCLMSVSVASNLLGMVGLLNLCIEKKQFIINRCCIFECNLCCTPVAAICSYEFKLLVVV